MSSTDLRDAYYTVPISPEHRKYIKFGVMYYINSPASQWDLQAVLAYLRK